MELHIKNHYYFYVEIGGQKEFLGNEDDFISFVISEEAGNVLPTFEFVFLLEKDKEDLLKYLNEGNIVKIRIGVSPDDAVEVELAIMNMTVERSGKHLWNIFLTGVLNKLPYMMESKIFSTDQISGVECIEQVVSNYFSTEFNVPTSTDKQYWIQPNVSDRKFVNDVWLHSYRPGSFLAMGITCDGKFILKDPKLDQSYKWKFDHRDPEAIKYHSDYVLKIRSGLMNSWVGHGKDRTVFDADGGEYVEESESFEPLLAMTNVFHRSSEVTQKASDFRIQNINVHDNYWAAQKRNITSSALFSSVTIDVEFGDMHRPIKVLDRVLFMEQVADSTFQDLLFLSGYYYVTKVVRHIQDKAMHTTVRLSREALSEIRGELK